MNNSYSTFGGFTTCLDCGATADIADAVVHYPTCKPGEAIRWEKFYEQTDEEVKQEKLDDDAYEKYLKGEGE